MSKAPTKTWSTTTRFNLYNPAFAQFMSASMLSPVPLVFTSPSHFLIWVSLPNPATRKESIPHRQSIATCYCTRPNKKKKLKNPPLRHLISRFATDGVKTCQNLRFATEPLRYLGVFQEEPEAWLKLFGKPKVCPQKIDYSNQYHDFKDI